MAEHGTVWWTELNTHHIEKARKFWTAVMGWKAHVTAMSDMSRPPKPGEDSYTSFMLGDKPVAGGFQLHGEMMKDVPEHWLTYFAVNDVDASAKKVVAEGGAVIREPFDIPGVGRIAVVKDNNGCVFGLGKPAMEMPAATAAPATKASAKAKKAKA